MSHAILVIALVFSLAICACAAEYHDSSGPLRAPLQKGKVYDGAAGSPEVLARSQVVALSDIQFVPGKSQVLWSHKDLTMLKVGNQYYVTRNTEIFLLLCPDVLGKLGAMRSIDDRDDDKIIIHCTTDDHINWSILIDIANTRFIYILPDQVVR